VFKKDLVDLKDRSMIPAAEIAHSIAKKRDCEYWIQVQTEALINHLRSICPAITDKQIVEFFEDVVDSYKL